MAGFKWRVSPSQGWDADNYQEAVDRSLDRVLGGQSAPVLESDAKKNAEWTDRTANARQTLAAFALKVDGHLSAVINTYTGKGNDTYAPFGRGKGWALILRQWMAYGLALETQYQGKYAIVLPTIQLNQRAIWANMIRQTGLKSRGRAAK